MVEHALDQHLDLAAGLFASGQPRFDHARVVHHQHVARLEQIRQFAKLPVGEVAASPVEMQQAARGAFNRGMLCDQRRRQFVIEIGEFQSVATADAEESG